MSLTYGSLFAGYGGLEMGVQSVLGGHAAWFSEIESAPAKILAHHWPDVPNLGDITKVDWATVPPVDVLTGGFPCQDVSHAGKRLGLKPGTRTGLWSHMVYAIATLRPRLVVAENVRGLFSAEAYSDMEPCSWCVGDHPERALRALGAVLGDLADLRYDTWWCGLRAADVGACHGRFRVFLFATPADADGELSRLGGRLDSRTHVRPTLTLLPTPAVNDMGAAYTPDEWDAWTAAMQAAHGNGNGHGPSLSVEALRLLPTPDAYEGSRGGSQHPDKRREAGHSPYLASVAEWLLPTPRATRGGSATETMALLPTPMAYVRAEGIYWMPEREDQLWTAPNDGGTPWLESAVSWVDEKQDWSVYEAAIRRHETMLGRPASPPTETGHKGGQRLSPRFVEWLMCLPAGHVTDVPGVNRNGQLAALGNGVVPPQAAAATRWWLTHIQERAA